VKPQHIAAVVAIPIAVFMTLVMLIALAVSAAESSAVCATGDTDPILRTIRTLESGGDYTARASGATASGAYQIVDGTWDNYGGYPSAYLAPPDIQDAKAAEHVAEILANNDGQIDLVPVVWYLGHVPPAGSREWDIVPNPQAGNRLTPREYQTRWMALYNTFVGDTATTTTTTSTTTSPTTTVPVLRDPTSPDPSSSTTAPAIPGTCVGGSVAAMAGDWSLPGPIALLNARPSSMREPHHDYPAWDWMIPTNTPIYAMRSGTVATVHTWPYNWWSQGCGTNAGSGCSSCGVGLTIRDATGTRWSYCHGTNLTVNLGDTITAGQQIMWSGNTGRSGGPHLHIEIRVAGIRRCPQPLLVSLHSNQTGLDPATLPTTGCFF
jgi:hypothetical protein